MLLLFTRRLIAYPSLEMLRSHLNAEGIPNIDDERIREIQSRARQTLRRDVGNKVAVTFVVHDKVAVRVIKHADETYEYSSLSISMTQTEEDDSGDSQMDLDWANWKIDPPALSSWFFRYPTEYIWRPYDSNDYDRVKAEAMAGVQKGDVSPEKEDPLQMVRLSLEWEGIPNVGDVMTNKIQSEAQEILQQAVGKKVMVTFMVYDKVAVIVTKYADETFLYYSTSKQQLKVAESLLDWQNWYIELMDMASVYFLYPMVHIRSSDDMGPAKDDEDNEVVLTNRFLGVAWDKISDAQIRNQDRVLIALERVRSLFESQGIPNIGDKMITKIQSRAQKILQPEADVGYKVTVSFVIDNKVAVRVIIHDNLEGDGDSEYSAISRTEMIGDGTLSDWADLKIDRPLPPSDLQFPTEYIWSSEDMDRVEVGPMTCAQLNDEDRSLNKLRKDFEWANHYMDSSEKMAQIIPKTIEGEKDRIVEKICMG